MNRSTAVRWLGYVAFAVVFAVACGFLSNWQFARNEERSAQLELVERNYDADPVPLAELIPPGGALSPDDQWHPVEVVGEYLTDDQVLVRNRPHGGTSAFEVLVPLRTPDGRVLVVNRGWVPPASDSPEPDTVAAAPAGTVTVIARLRPSEAAPTSGRAAPAGQVPTINLGLVAAETGLGSDVISSAYGVMVDESPAATDRPRELEDPSADPGPHLSYAIQWILFAVMGFVFIWYMIRTERRHRREDAEEAAALAARPVEQTPHGTVEQTPPASRSAVVPASALPPSLRRRSTAPRDRDMQDEDAILDSSSR